MAINFGVPVYIDDSIPRGEVEIDWLRKSLKVCRETFEQLKKRIGEANEYHTKTSQDAEPDGSENIWRCLETARKTFPRPDYNNLGAWDLHHHLQEAYRFATLLERAKETQ